MVARFTATVQSGKLPVWADDTRKRFCSLSAASAATTTKRRTCITEHRNSGPRVVQILRSRRICNKTETMLAEEKKRALWSIAVGALLAIAVEGTVRVLEWHATQRLNASVTDCEKPDPKNPVGKGHWEAVCKPSDLRGMTRKGPDGEYTVPVTDEDLIAGGGVTARIVQEDQAVDGYRQDNWFYSAIVIALSCVTFVWYFLIDRIREISAAVSGRDRST